MNKYEVTVALNFDVTVPVWAENQSDAESKADEMQLSEFLDWAGCASYNMNIHEVKEVEK